MQLEKLLKKIRGNDARNAYRAIAQLRFPHDATVADTIASYKPKDEQRRFQYRLAVAVAREGTAGLARHWFALGTQEQRQHLLQEIPQFWNEWESEGTVEAAIVALDEPNDKVRGYALICAKAAAESQWMTPERGARITRALVRAMVPHEEKPLGLFWLEKYVELLGLVGDESVLGRLEKLRAVAGESRRTTVEKLDPDNLPYPYPNDPAAWPAGLPKPGYRVMNVGTGLLEIKVLETAIQRIRAR